MQAAIAVGGIVPTQRETLMGERVPWEQWATEWLAGALAFVAAVERYPETRRELVPQLRELLYSVSASLPWLMRRQQHGVNMALLRTVLDDIRSYRDLAMPMTEKNTALDRAVQTLEAIIAAE